jgi:transcriptional regulator with XRE-family HTH domain
MNPQEQIKYIISQRGLTKNQAADLCGYTKSHFSGLLNGHHSISQKKLEHIFSSLGYTFKVFYQIQAKFVSTQTYRRVIRDIRVELFESGEYLLLQEHVQALTERFETTPFILGTELGKDLGVEFQISQDNEIRLKA